MRVSLLRQRRGPLRRSRDRLQSCARWPGSRHRRQHEGLGQILATWRLLKQLKKRPTRSAGTLPGCFSGCSVVRREMRFHARRRLLLATNCHPSASGQACGSRGGLTTTDLSCRRDGRFTPSVRQEALWQATSGATSDSPMWRR
jgi:hypothetical protein